LEKQNLPTDEIRYIIQHETLNPKMQSSNSAPQENRISKKTRKNCEYKKVTIVKKYYKNCTFNK